MGRGGELVGRTVRGIYHEMQQHYLSFRLLVWLKEHGITRKVNFLISHKISHELKEDSADERQKSREYFAAQKERAEWVLSLLADEKSVNVWKEAVGYRTMGRPIGREYYSEEDQYFVKDIIRLKDGEVFVDGGSYTGDTIQQFMDTARREKVRFKQIIGFEPDRENYGLVNKFYGKKKNILLIPKGLSDMKKVLCFSGEGATFGACESAGSIGGGVKIPVINIDAVPACRNATFIKMDIEGAEMDALKGARMTIQTNHPKLAICIYHSDEDMLRIIEYIHELVPEYRLYVRHHSKSNVETVLYAVL